MCLYCDNKMSEFKFLMLMDNLPDNIRCSTCGEMKPKKDIELPNIHSPLFRWDLELQFCVECAHNAFCHAVDHPYSQLAQFYQKEDLMNARKIRDELK